MKAKSFRQVPKEYLQIQIPPSLSGAIRQLAAKQRRSISEVACEAMAIGLGHDPASYGIAAENPLST